MMQSSRTFVEKISDDETVTHGRQAIIEISRRDVLTLHMMPNFNAEWLEADGLGGFASGTAGGIRTRRYHALLLAATTPPAGRMVLINGADVELETEGVTTPLSQQRYLPGVNAPSQAPPLADFSPEPWPRWTFSLPQGDLIYELFVPRGHAACVLRWTWTGPVTSPLTLRVRPFFSGRDFHALHYRNPSFRFEPQTVLDRQRWDVYDGVPPIFARGNGAYRHDPHWYLNFLYDEEQARGLDCAEDLASPGSYEFDLAVGAAVLIFSTDELELELSAANLAQKWAQIEELRRSAFLEPRLRAADAYLARRGEGRTIMAGYPWFGDWGRDTFIALRGLCLATGWEIEAGEILLAWTPYVSQGMLPNRFPDRGEEPEYNSVDASLWYVIAVHDYLQLAGDAVETDARAALLTAVESILVGYSKGTRFGIRADSDGLLACGLPGTTNLTWMDARLADVPVTPRVGKPVEVQALWLNALALAGESEPHWHFLFIRGLTSFHDRFWNEDKDCLYDVIDVDHAAGTLDASLRPNQILAVGGLPLMIVEGDRAERLMQTVQDALWTPMGPRSLAPDEPGYAPFYQGDLNQRDHAYHQGTVWPWLAGPFIEAWVRLRGNTPEAQAQARDEFLGTLLRSDLAGLGHVPEIADATAPFTARGCPFQAWSLGELLRLEYKVLAQAPNPS
jgi:predicted glycogen debranching enzyme